MPTIEQLEREVWPDPGPDATFLVTRCTELRRKPLADFTAEDLRIMLGQAIGVPALLPLAVGILRDDPLVEGDHHPGDLLLQVLRLPHSAWSGLAAEREHLKAVLAHLLAGPALSDPDLPPREVKRFREAIEQFLARPA
ncbi:contact-dependent growth inhibition system immunity protein [Micromonospora sp. CV4]|uniref:contact-dependent growth inhibition system immunity protein n=1 Tax=Micromonospora sp. CV4 TaxID=2478711 RepID=UPI00131556FD|nr:contact-dependent growth inhibition system immunity protein [Micromonospora sp. CV4]